MKMMRLAVTGGILCVSAVSAETYTWNGNGGDSNWTAAANWDKNLLYPGAAAGYVDVAVVSAAGALHMDTNGVVTLNHFNFSPVPSTNLTVTGNAGTGLDFKYFTVGGSSVVEFLPDTFWPPGSYKLGSGTLAVPGNLTAAAVSVNDGTLRIAGGNAVINGWSSIGSAGKTAALHLTEGGTMQWKNTIASGGGTPLVRLSGGTLQVSSSMSCDVPLLVDGTNTLDAPSTLTLNKGLTMTGQGHLTKSGAGGLILSGTTNFVSGGLTISSNYVSFSMNTLSESYGGSTEPWQVKVYNNGRFFFASSSAILTVPLDLVVDSPGTVEFSTVYDSNYSVLVAHSIVTNGVSLPTGRYIAGSGFIKAGGGGCVVLATRWTGAGDGVSWTDSNNWSGAVPDGSNAVADISNALGPVSLGSQNVTLACLVYNPQGTQRAITMTGSGTLSFFAPFANAGCLVVGPGRTLTMDVSVACASGSKSLGIFGNGTVIVKKGFPAGVPTQGRSSPSAGIMGNLIFDGTTAITGDTYNILSVNALAQPCGVRASIPWTNRFDTTVTFATNCRMTVFGILGNCQLFYPVKQFIHDGAEITLASSGYVFLTRYADYYTPPFAYFMRAGSLNTNATLTIASGGLVNLAFSGAVTVNALIVNGEEKSPGTYGSWKPFITGTGLLCVLNGPPLRGTMITIH